MELSKPRDDRGLVALSLVWFPGEDFEEQFPAHPIGGVMVPSALSSYPKGHLQDLLTYDHPSIR
jgi:hypothetical protein